MTHVFKEVYDHFQFTADMLPYWYGRMYDGEPGSFKRGQAGENLGKIIKLKMVTYNECIIVYIVYLHLLTINVVIYLATLFSLCSL